MTATTLPALIDTIKARSRDSARTLVALAGPPASGKSTLASDLAGRLGPHAAVLPMDGFHLDNDDLQKIGLLHRKGAPQTFDAKGFVEMIRRLRTQDVVSYPTFDRAADRTVPEGGVIGADTRIVLVEGNYLLLDSAPWSDLAPLWDVTVALRVSPATLEDRLVARWRKHGLSLDAARTRARENDLANALYVENHARPAEFTLNTGS